VKLQFEANQQFQLDAIEAVAGLFDGQPQGDPAFSVIRVAGGDGLFAGQERSELGLGNRLLLGDETLRRNLRAIQRRNDIDASDDAPIEGWSLFDISANKGRLCPHFSVEMETGTGKTYVYLRTILELSRRYGFAKFVIVVPSVAIREGVLKNLEITADHFSALYDNMPIEYFVYDARRVNRLRQFATANTVQIAIINIDAFRKNFTGTDDERKSNVMYKESDRLSGRQPIEFVQAARPIVIIDEPQSVDNTEKAQEAIMALNPLCTLRYSATHRNPYNLVYRLDPIKAFELRLVKQIVVASAAADGAGVDAFVRVEKIEQRPAIRAKLRIDVQTAEGPTQRTIVVRDGSDLFTASNERAAYRVGYSIAEIYAEPGAEFIRLTNGKTLRIGEEIGGMRDDVWRAQIKHTVRKHLDRELQLQSRRVKVLSLFFVDRVANYRDYDTDGRALPGKFAKAFEEELTVLAREEHYKSLPWLSEPLDRLHNGYFASDKSHRLKDTNGNTQADDDAYALIMKEKERLLSFDEPLRFIFSHSALREGWDNPNVFQICTLNEGRSAVKKRQEIGRGLRLPVDADGKRIFDDSINKLYVMANESYEEFARTLQGEYEDDCGVTFGKVPIRAIAKLTREVHGREEPIGDVAAQMVADALVAKGMLGTDGRIGSAFDPAARDFSFSLPSGLEDLEAAVVDLLSSYRLERHVRRERDEGRNRLKKEVLLSPEFTALWDRIKPKTTYRVEFDTQSLVAHTSNAIRHMSRLAAPTVRVAAGRLDPKRGGVDYSALSSAEEKVDLAARGLPDILAYLQEQTELTRSTIYRILHDSERLSDFFVNPQRFMDAVAAIMKRELHALMIDGIKYERVEAFGEHAEWEQWLFKDAEIIDYLTSLQVRNSVYDYVPYDSDVELRFARALDAREDIKLFLKLPSWFKIDTPIGTYNPDWAIVKGEESVVYLVRETKSTRNYLRLRNSESDKVRCGLAHFEALGVSFDVATSAADV
jgi:type III restriction enzyme